jgi:hypothetical protein
VTAPKSDCQAQLIHSPIIETSESLMEGTDDKMKSHFSATTPSRMKEDRWLSIRPTTANPSMSTPPILLRRGAEDKTVKYDTDSPHLVAPPTGSADCNNMCHVYLCGTGCNPTENNAATWWLSTTADRGVATIGLSYQWGPYTDTERNIKCYEESGGRNSTTQVMLGCYHSDIIFGGDDSGLVDVTSCNSIEGRLMSLIKYLMETRPVSEGWGKYLSPIGSTMEEINYEKFIFSGHSQGAGHVCFLAKHAKLGRAVFLSGPQEYIPQADQLLITEAAAYLPSSPEHKTRAEVALATAAVSNRNSWLDGSYATQDIRAFMHIEEEYTADLIRRNWSRISPIALHYEKGYTDIEDSEGSSGSFSAEPSSCTNGFLNSLENSLSLFDACRRNTKEEYEIHQDDCLEYINAVDKKTFHCNTMVDGTGESFRTFFSRIAPSAPSDLCGGRPNHNSTVSDRNTPILITHKSKVPPILHKSLLQHSDNYSHSEFVAVPIYYSSIWSHLLEGIPPGHAATISKL